VARGDEKGAMFRSKDDTGRVLRGTKMIEMIARHPELAEGQMPIVNPQTNQMVDVLIVDGIQDDGTYPGVYQGLNTITYDSSNPWYQLDDLEIDCYALPMQGQELSVGLTYSGRIEGTSAWEGKASEGFDIVSVSGIGVPPVQFALQYVSNICELNISGRVGIQVEYRTATFTLPAGTTVSLSDPTCIINPTNCCVSPPIPCPCAIPSPVYAYISSACSAITNGLGNLLVVSVGTYQGLFPDSCVGPYVFNLNIGCNQTTGDLYANIEIGIIGTAESCSATSVVFTNVSCSYGIFCATATFSNWQSSGGPGNACLVLGGIGCSGPIVIKFSGQLGTCGVPSELTPFWNCCSTGSCVQVYGTGTYSSLSACAAVCSESPPPSVPPPPPPGSCPTSGIVSVAMSGFTGAFAALNGVYTLNYLSGITFLYTNSGCTEGSSTFCLFQIGFNCGENCAGGGSGAIGCVSISGYCGGGDTEGWAGLANVSGSLTPSLLMTGTGFTTSAGSCSIASQNPTFTVLGV
jgi:hypothetical protein